MFRNLVVSVATATAVLPNTSTVMGGYLFMAFRQNPVPESPATENERSVLAPEPSVQFGGLEVGSVWRVTCQAAQPNGEPFGPLVEGLIEISDFPEEMLYQAPSGLSFFLD